MATYEEKKTLSVQRRLSMEELVDQSRKLIALGRSRDEKIERAKELQKVFKEKLERMKDAIEVKEAIINTGMELVAMRGSQFYCTDRNITWFESEEGEVFWEREMTDKEREKTDARLFESEETDEVRLVASSGDEEPVKVRNITLRQRKRKDEE